MPSSRTLDHLARLYARDPDPWGHRTRGYERRKHALTLAALGSGDIDLALEVGCGNGTLTRRLARRCGRVVAMECVAAAYAEAQRSLADLQNVELLQAAAPTGLPDLHPNLILLSEVLYYMTPDEILGLAEWRRTRAPDARIVCVNWTGDTGETLDGAAAIQHFSACLDQGATTELHDGFRIDVFDIPSPHTSSES